MRLNKIEKLKNGNQLFVFWANNAGRGSNNCTLQIVPPTSIRKIYSRETENIIAQTRTSSWKGDVNFSENVCDRLGISKTDLI